MSNKQRITDLQEKVQKLNDVSPTFCLAKWKQSTTTLYNGMTHSCHHPAQHKIKVEDIKRNPRGLHNTPIKIVAREDMLKGIQTKECDYCWNIENLDKNHISDRHYKSVNEGMGIWQSFQEVLDSGKGENIDPSYLEVAFESTCNFKCSYCSPDVSSRWMEEVQQHGSYKLNGYEHHHLGWLKQEGRFPIHHKEENPYIDAFWEWWPELYKSLNTFRITGGEPLLSNNTWKILDHIIEQPRADLAFSINTNMGIPRKLVDKLIDKVNLIDGKIRNVTIYTSTESTGPQAEYSRFGMDWELFKSNVEHLLLSTPNSVRLHFMTTVNVFSTSTFADFLRWVSTLRKQFNPHPGFNRVGFNVAYLRWPTFLCITQLTAEQKIEFEKSMRMVIEELQSKTDIEKMYLEEVDMIERLINFANSKDQDQNDLVNFGLFIDEYDKRRGTDFFNIFPELIDMYQMGK